LFVFFFFSDDEFAGMPLEGLDNDPFAVEDSPENIRLSKDGQIKGASLAKLIEHITPKHSPGMLTVPSFSAPCGAVFGLCRMVHSCFLSRCYFWTCCCCCLLFVFLRWCEN
jgi:hypothetical protein